MKTIITIGRQAGSGGKEIGEKLASALGVKCYDRELLERAAKESGFCEEIFENHDEKPTRSFLYSLVMDTYSYGYSTAAYRDMPINHKVFLAQFDAIKKIADEGPCILVGRCADYALDEYDHVLRLFLYAPLDVRAERVGRLHNLSAGKAKEQILKSDKQRASYYNYYTNKKWGDAMSYDLCINTSILGIDGTVELIKNIIDTKEKLTEQ